MSERRRFTPEFRAKVVLEALSGSKSSAEICRQHEIGAPLLSSWKATFLERAALVFQGDEQGNSEQGRMTELERLVGRQALEIEVPKKPPTCWVFVRAEAGGHHDPERRVPH